MPRTTTPRGERALQPMLPTGPQKQPKRTISRARLVDLLERVRMEAATGVAAAVSEQQRHVAILELTSELWREITGEPAPELEISARVVAS